MENLNLTQLEEKILTTLIDNLYEPGYSDLVANDLSKLTNIDIKITRGVLSSLVKKEIIWIESGEGIGESKIVYLSENHYNLHPEWKDFEEEFAKGGKIVWVGDMPLDIGGREELTEEEAERLAKEWKEKGYDDVIIEDYAK